MLRRDVKENGVVVYVSPALERIGVPHGFSTRIGGVSQGVFGTMNLGNPSGVELQDEESRIDENYRRFHAALGVSNRERCSVHQAHGPNVVRVNEGASHDRRIKADALVSRDASRILSVRIADCIPVLLASRDGRVVGAVHAGWRGVVTGVVAGAIREMEVPGSELAAAIGPGIGIDAFEIGPEVVEQFARVFGSEAPMRLQSNGKGRVDLKEAIRKQLIGAGLNADHIDLTDRCSYRDADEFFSHRRENGITGRMAAMIGARG